MTDDTRDMREGDMRPADRAASDGPTPPDSPSTTGFSSQRRNDHVPPDVIAAWLDTPDDFDAVERESIATHIGGCPTCQEVVADLQRVVSALASLPQVTVPRSFSLTPEMVGEQALVRRPVAAREPTPMRQTAVWYERQMRGVRWATAVAAALFVFVLSLDLVTNRIDPDRVSEDAAMSAPSDMTTAASGASGGGAAESMPEGSGGDDAGTSSEMKVAEDAESAEESGNTEMAQPEEESGGTDNMPMSADATPASDQGGNADQAADSAATEETTDATLAVEESDGDGSQDAEADSDAAATSGGQGSTVVDESTERLRIIQVALALILVWLLAAMIALPRMRRR